jgi:hypothetical protein
MTAQCRATPEKPSTIFLGRENREGSAVQEVNMPLMHGESSTADSQRDKIAQEGTLIFQGAIVHKYRHRKIDIQDTLSCSYANHAGREQSIGKRG